VSRVLDRWRVSAIHHLGGVVPTRGLTYDELVHLLFPHIHEPRIRGEIDGAGTGDLSDPATIRRMIGAVEQQLSPTAFTIRFGPGDVSFVDVHGIRLALDAADASVARQMEESGAYEPHLTAVFERYCRPGMTVVDVGANIGYYSLLASRLVGPSGRVIAIEPNSENCRLLLTSLAEAEAKNVDLLPVACSREIGWAYFSSHFGSNGGFIPDDDLVHRPGTVVPVFPLDALVRGKVDFLKLDVEGAEALVVAGAREVLSTSRPVVTTEFSCDMLTRVSDCDPEAYLEGFVDYGYTISVIDRDTGALAAVDSPADLLASWGDRYRIEDLLLLPG
jgi:FkbM family methyltransferase